jgi:hypothetical protein
MFKTSLVTVALLTLTLSCGPRRSGTQGLPGVSGDDGFSLVVDVVTQSSGALSCKRTDIFQDLDRNNIFSTGDRYQNGFLVCNGAVGASGNDGAQGSQGEQGIQGEQGEQGETGLQGEAGQNGVNGLPGLNADTTYQVTEIIDPCGQQHPNGYDEVILKLGNGKYLASFSDNANGLNTRFGVLPAGTYRTTDGTNCTFTL